MTVALCTLVLNEMEWLPKLYEQHKNWPGLVKWVFVESADRVYANTNPELVSDEGLSVDGTTAFLYNLSLTDPRVVHVPYGFCTHPDPAQGKCEARQQYLTELESVKPDILIVVDADEFYPTQFQLDMVNCIQSKLRTHTGFIFKHRDIWHPECISDAPLMKYEVCGGFWDIPYCRGWKWFPDLKYSSNHNTPSVGNYNLDRKLVRFDQVDNTPYFVHMGFASSPKTRLAKNSYYAARGESSDPKRSWYVDSRNAFRTWRPGDKLPRNAKVCLYDGLVPECFKE